MRPGFWCAMIIAAAVAMTKLGDSPLGVACSPSAVCAIVTCALVYGIARRLAASDVAAWSGVCFSTMWMFGIAARSAIGDAWFLMTSTLAVACFVHFAFAIDDEDTPAGMDASNPSEVDRSLRAVRWRWPRWHHWGLVYIACGLSSLVHGVASLLLPGSAIFLTTFLIAEPRGSDQSIWRRTVACMWRMRPLSGFTIVLTVVGLSIFAGHSPPPQMATHWSPSALVLPGTFPVATFPWSCFAVPIGLAAWRRRRQGLRIEPLIGLSIACLVVSLAGSIAVSVSGSLDDSLDDAHPSPAALALAMAPCLWGAAWLAGWYVARAIRGRVDDPRWMTVALGCSVLTGVGLYGAVGMMQADRFLALRPLAIGGMMLAVAGTLGAAFAARQQRGMAIRAFVVGGVLLTWLMHGFNPAAPDRGRRAEQAPSVLTGPPIRVATRPGP